MLMAELEGIGRRSEMRKVVLTVLIGAFCGTLRD